jgi:aminoglycoside 3-N-acetyltransferase
VRSRRDRGMRTSGAPMIVDGVHRWVSFSEPDFGDHDGFQIAGDALLAAGAVRTGMVGSARAMTGPLRTIVDGAVEAWTD